MMFIYNTNAKHILRLFTRLDRSGHFRIFISKINDVFIRICIMFVYDTKLDCSGHFSTIYVMIENQAYIYSQSKVAH